MLLYTSNYSFLLHIVKSAVRKALSASAGLTPLMGKNVAVEIIVQFEAQGFGRLHDVLLLVGREQTVALTRKVEILAPHPGHHPVSESADTAGRHGIERTHEALGVAHGGSRQIEFALALHGLLPAWIQYGQKCQVGRSMPEGKVAQAGVSLIASRGGTMAEIAGYVPIVEGVFHDIC